MLEHNILIVIADGSRVRIFRNAGTAQTPKLDLLTGFEQKNAPTHQQGTDKPGSVFSSAGSNRSHVNNSDHHEEQEKAFAGDIIRAASDCLADKNHSGLIWVAPPRMLAKLRANASPQLQKIKLREIDKDLTKHTPQDIVKIISG